MLNLSIVALFTPAHHFRTKLYRPLTSSVEEVILDECSEDAAASSAEMVMLMLIWKASGYS